EPPVAGLYIAELPLEDAERVLDLGPHHGDDPVDLLVLGVKRAGLGRLAHHSPDLATVAERRLPLGADIALVGPDRALLAMRPFVPDLAVGDLGGRGLEAVGHAALGIDAYMCLPPEVPRVALLRGRHLRIAGARLVLGRRRRVDNRRIHQRP